MAFLDVVQHKLIVSCQALPEEPLHGPMLMAALARAAALGGAAAIRTNGVNEVEVIKKITSLPVIGIKKMSNEKGEICITPTFALAKALVMAGAEVIAVDARQKRPFGEPLEQLLPRIQKELGVLVMADCETLQDACTALQLGADIVAPTFGFKETSLGSEPDFTLLAEMIRLGQPVIAEGGFWYPEQIVQALDLGAWAVVVGSAITRPQEITKRFVRALENRERKRS